MMKSLRETIERYQEMLPLLEEMYKEGELSREQYDMAGKTMTMLQMSFSQLMREEYMKTFGTEYPDNDSDVPQAVKELALQKTGLQGSSSGFIGEAVDAGGSSRSKSPSEGTTLEMWPIIKGTVRLRKRRYDHATVWAPLLCIQFLAASQNTKGPTISGTPLNEIDTQRPRTLGDWLWTDMKDFNTHKLWVARKKLFGSLSDDAVPSKLGLLRQRIKADESCRGAWMKYDVQREAFWERLESKQVGEPAQMGIIPEMYETGNPNSDSESDHVKSDAEESQSESEAD
ncbi:hypothetical protein QFC21_006683 [Naganishia friedmannii]|uniref:Uncharacterized protein n=1 Tax=Naganishia friedmannii TaxID=89922 RepID=A0ACC2V2F9_9TREE|nr:hypothetical protein QFC21_006683 [Naganishia friedmannii]